MRRTGMIQMIMPDAYIRKQEAATLARDLGDLFGRDLADQPPIVPQQLRGMSRCIRFHACASSREFRRWSQARATIPSHRLQWAGISPRTLPMPDTSNSVRPAMRCRSS